MTPEQREAAELLRDLQTDPKRAAIVIAANTGLPLEFVQVWLKTGRWPVPRLVQRSLFDAGDSPQEATKPTTTASGQGLHRLFNPTGKSDTTRNPLKGSHKHDT
ncbi:MAG: hypothetical protein DWH91_17930 [Planctomycetota bacterium]|nr:MAG: hypothetical protein DWH91_17930 [Planctomycetota bacterium]